jgi:hypothetical protein
LQEKRQKMVVDIENQSETIESTLITGLDGSLWTCPISTPGRWRSGYTIPWSGASLVPALRIALALGRNGLSRLEIELLPVSRRVAPRHLHYLVTNGK